MAGIDVKMGVSGIAQFKQAMNQSQQSVKTLTAALNLNEKQLQATGDKETYMANKSKLLKQQIAEQNNVIKQGQQALKTMEQQGVTPASKAYQDMQQRVLNAQAALLDMNSSLNTVGQSEEETAQKTDKLTTSLNGINKKVSFDAVLNGIGKITDGMEAAARKVEALARDVWDTMAMAASWADNELTLADMYGLSVEELQQYQFAAGKAETTVEAIIKSQQKLKNNMVYGSDDVYEAFQKLGVSIGYVTGKGNEINVFRDATDVYWDLGEALLQYEDAIERDAMANKIFGRSWQELMPMFKKGREEFEKNMELAPTVDEEKINKLNELSEAIENLDAEYQKTKNTILSELAPAFTEVGNTVSGLIRQFNEYLNTPEGQAKLEELSQAVTELFSGLSDVDFGTALDTAESILDGIIDALGWIADNKDSVVDAIKGIGIAFLGLKGAEIVGTLAQGAAALKNLFGGGSSAGSAGNAAAGAATITKITTGSKLLDALGIGALFKTAKEASENLGTGIWGALVKNQQMQEISVVGYVDPLTGKIYTKEELQTAQTTGGPKRTRNITGTASEDSMKGADQLREERIQAIYDELYRQINDFDPAISGIEADRFFDNVLSPLVQEAARAGGVTGEAAEDIADLIKEKFLDSFEEDWEGTTGGLLNILQEAIDEKAQGLTVETTPILTEDAAGILQEQLAGVALSVPVYPDLASVDGSHANGLPFVPFDGYIAALHRGERVVPANQNRSYSNTSNIYFDNVNVNSGADADGLAALIAERTKHTLAGFGG